MNRFIQNYNGQEYDLLIIGGGITGASIAYEAASRGLKTALVEKNDFASATSAATSRMIHGGLRYLATGEFNLVRESLHERTVLQNIAPNFVHPQPFIFAVYDYMKSPMWMIKTGLMTYEVLSYDRSQVWDKNKKIPRFNTLTPRDIIRKFPSVIEHGLKGGFLYYDCKNHSPERLTLAFIKSAIHYGAHVANYAKVTGFLYEKINGKIHITGSRIYDQLKGKTLEIKTKLIVNASGPWADIMISHLLPDKPIKHIRRSEGIHLVINKKFSDKYIFASQDRNQEHFFIIPFRGYTIVGTTDKEFKGDPDNYTITKQSVDYLINKINSALKPEYHISYNDIVLAYGGLRPLVEDRTKDVYSSSRKYEITDHARDNILGLITVEGGKFTTSRRLAQKVTDRIFRKLNKKLVKSISASNYLVTSQIADLENFITIKSFQYPMFTPRQIRYLVYSYGTEIDRLMDIYLTNPGLQKILNKDGENLAQVVYAIHHEMAYTLTDILLRRTGIGWIGQPSDETLSLIARTAAQYLGWDNTQIKQQINDFKKIFSLVNSLKNNAHEKTISATMD